MTSACLLRHCLSASLLALAGFSAVAICSDHERDPLVGTCGLRDFQTQVLEAANRARTAGRQCGDVSFDPALPLVWNATLYKAAHVHSLYMAASGDFNHTTSAGLSFDQRIRAAGYRIYAAGENIAVGHVSVDEVMQSWLASPGHCANLMHPLYQDIGVACSRNVDGRNYWTMELGAPRL